VSLHYIVAKERDQGESGWTLKTFPEMGNVKCANRVGLMAQDDLRLSPSEYDETQVSARRTGVTRLNMQGPGAKLGRSGLNLPKLSGIDFNCGAYETT
jgi:hypothetical protein